MTEKVLLYDEVSFQQFVITKIQELLPEDAVIEKVEEEKMTYKINYNNDSGMTLYLGNAWENYQRTNDLNVIIEFINANKNVFATFALQDEKPKLNMENVYPVFRGKDFGINLQEKTEIKDMDVEMIRDTFSDVLDVLYIQDHGSFVSFVMDNMLPDGMTEEAFSEAAFDNLKKQGWVHATEQMPIGKLATLYIFSDLDKSYQAQFMVKDMYKDHLDDYFFFTTPTRDLTFVLSFHENPDNHLPFFTECALRLKQMTINAYQQEQGPLSHVIHRVSPDGIKALA